MNFLRHTFIILCVLWAGISLAADQYNEGKVLVPSITVYSAYDNSSFEKGVVQKGETVRVYGQKGDRYFIHFFKNLERLEGWVDKDAIQLGRRVSSARNEVGSPKVYPGVVLAEKIYAYDKPSSKGKVVSRFKRDDKVDVITQNPNWYKLKISFMDGSIGTGWVDKRTVKLLPRTSAPAAVSAAPAPIAAPPPLSAKQSEPKPSTVVEAGPTLSATKFSGYRVFMAPVACLKTCKPFQMRIGLGYDFEVTKDFSIGVPLTFAFLGGVKSLQAGLDGFYRIYGSDGWAFYGRLGILFEDIFKSLSKWHQSLRALTADIGVGFQYQLTPGFAVYVEPGLEVSPWDTDKAHPWFARAQGIVGLRGTW